MTRREDLERRLALYRECERAILSGAAEYEIGDRRLKRADLAKIRRAIDDLEAALANETLKHGRVKRVTFID